MAFKLDREQRICNTKTGNVMNGKLIIYSFTRCMLWGHLVMDGNRIYFKLAIIFRRLKMEFNIVLYNY